LETPVLSVPEFTVAKDSDFMFFQHNIGLAGQPFVVLSVSDSGAPQCPAEHDFYRRIFAFDSAHVVAPLFRFGSAARLFLHIF
jgi:hypothetical protein